jgi:hypothetical protein
MMAERLVKKEGLPAGTPRYRFHGKAQCLKTIEYTLSLTHHSFIIFDGVDHHTFHKFFQKGRVGQLLKTCILSYGIMILNITMETSVHATAQGEFMSLVRDWSSNQTERLRSSTGSVVQRNSRGKKPDGTWRPNRATTDWPSVVVEIGWTEGPTKLKKDIEFWLGGETRAAISLNITETGRMTLDAWRKNENGKIESYQRLYINTRGSVSGDFTIPFHAFYHRDRHETETDFIITHQMFSHLATTVRAEIKLHQDTKAAEKAAADNSHSTSG